MSTLAARRYDALWAPLVAAALATLAVVAAIRGLDLPAALYRVELFHSSGLTLWDNQWYGGHWTLNYSTLFPPVAGIFGLNPTKILSAALAAWAFDRIVVEHFGRRARIGSLLFAVGTLAQVAQAQLPFLLGESLALTAFLMTCRRRWAPAVALGLAASLASPLAGAFLALGVATSAVTGWPARRIALGAVAAAALAPVIVAAILFPGQGSEGFPLVDFLWLLPVYVGALVWVGDRHRGLRIGLLLYLAAIAGSFAVPSPVGENISRLGECMGAALVVCLLASGRMRTAGAAEAAGSAEVAARWPGRVLAALQPGRTVTALGGGVLIVVLLALQWGAAMPSLFSGGDPSKTMAYFRPLISYLSAHDGSAGRVEVVPTEWHWEAAYVAPVVPLARGWERQLDTANNPLFYGQAPLTASTYHAWLVQNGVRYVALPDAALDYAGTGEGRLVRAGVPGLRPVWHDSHWRVFAVSGGPGIVSGPAHLTQWGASTIQLDSRAAGSVVVRIRYSPNWDVTAGNACVTQAAGGWIAVQTRAPGPVTLGVDPLAAAKNAC